MNKGHNRTVVNPTCHSIDVGSLEKTSTVPLIRKILNYRSCNFFCKFHLLFSGKLQSMMFLTKFMNISILTFSEKKLILKSVSGDRSEG